MLLAQRLRLATITAQSKVSRAIAGGGIGACKPHVTCVRGCVYEVRWKLVGRATAAQVPTSGSTVPRVLPGSAALPTNVRLTWTEEF